MGIGKAAYSMAASNTGKAVKNNNLKHLMLGLKK